MEGGEVGMWNDGGMFVVRWHGGAGMQTKKNEKRKEESENQENQSEVKERKKRREAKRKGEKTMQGGGTGWVRKAKVGTQRR